MKTIGQKTDHWSPGTGSQEEVDSKACEEIWKVMDRFYILIMMLVT